ncbi:hypothetical protein [Plesiocystis pacifica]|uniref:hypothetical protein n=1 Tax=Plesiocystis pacifica TaxID=191768 RepID=UPI0002E0C361|nr:hypothetical protein [Plesiocystis pacifica]
MAQARPEAPRAFCETYPEVPECAGVVVTCDTCHLSTDPPSWNGFGLDLLAELGPLTADGTSFEEALPEALQLIELEDSDGDGVSNRDEILVGTRAGDATSVWLPDPGGSAGEGEDEILPNPWYALGEYDPAFALRRVLVLYCGRSPTYEQLQEFVALGETSGAEAQRTRLHEHLSSCLAGEWWRTTGVTELADPKVKPIKAVGSETKVEIAGFRVVLADYDWDYRLWRWIMTEDRDVRDLLLADYHVVEGEDGGLEIITGAIGDPTNLGQLAGGQPLQPDKRAGMMTTQWF